MISIVYIVIGLFLLVKGGDILVKASTSIARSLRLSPLVIGLTVIGFGTSMPELCVSAQAALAKAPAISIGNVAGSNICNIALILGLTAVIKPLRATHDMLWRSIPFFGFAILLMMFFAYTGKIERWMGGLMVVAMIVQVIMEIKLSRGISNDGCEGTKPKMSLIKAIPLTVASIAIMIWASDLLVKGARVLAMCAGFKMGIDEAVMERLVALTVVAVGTSLPELCASVMAARKGETDMAIGNIVGSGIFNILCVIGVSSTISPIENAWKPFWIDYAVELFLCILLWLFLSSHRMLQRWEGCILLSFYIVYMLFLCNTVF